jgi:hypothetical protein
VKQAVQGLLGQIDHIDASQPLALPQPRHLRRCRLPRPNRGQHDHRRSIEQLPQQHRRADIEQMRIVDQQHQRPAVRPLPKRSRGVGEQRHRVGLPARNRHDRHQSAQRHPGHRPGRGHPGDHPATPLQHRQRFLSQPGLAHPRQAPEQHTLAACAERPRLRQRRNDDVQLHAPPDQRPPRRNPPGLDSHTAHGSGRLWSPPADEPERSRTPYRAPRLMGATSFAATTLPAGAEGQAQPGGDGAEIPV